MLEAFIGSDLFNAGITEDGEAVLAERFYVCVEAPNGQRWVHNVKFDSTKAVDGGEECDGMFFFPDQSQEAKAAIQILCDRVEAHLKAGGTLDPAMWSGTDPRYGSEAYSVLDNQGYFRAMERKAEFEK
ncbi:hypothetical protein D3C73_111780 [compost metagenome]